MTARKGDAGVAIMAGRAIYESLRERLETKDKGSFVVIDVVSGD